MMVYLNGEDVSIDLSCSVRQLLEQRGLGSTPCAVEVNRRLVPKGLHEKHALAEGDRIEIVTLVGGG